MSIPTHLFEKKIFFTSSHNSLVKKKLPIRFAIDQLKFMVKYSKKLDVRKEDTGSERDWNIHTENTLRKFFWQYCLGAI